ARTPVRLRETIEGPRALPAAKGAAAAGLCAARRGVAWRYVARRGAVGAAWRDRESRGLKPNLVCNQQLLLFTELL
ncbi:Protein of unknown function, partial [Gryllus bimaculatus]